MAAVRGVILDISGVLYEGDTPVPGARESLIRLRDAGLGLRFITNTTRKPRCAILEQLNGMGFEVSGGELLTAASAARRELERRRLVPHLLLHPALAPEFADLTGGTPNAVIVADAADAFTYAAMNRAFRLIMDGAVFLAVNRNRYFRDRDGLSLDAGPFVAALEEAAGVKAELIGKPARALFDAATESLGLSPDEVVMVGDDVESDVNGALQAGIKAVLVRTGKYRDGDDERMQAGGEVLADIREFVASVLARR